VKQLDASLEEFREAHQKARSTTEKWDEIIDYPSDLGVLYRINTWILGGTELVEQFMQNVDNYYHGRDYLAPVDWGKVFALTPELRDSHY
jgi:dihydrofolate reductase